jgi:hypothetical protein
MDRAIRVRIAEPDDRATVAALLARAFVDDPALRYFFPDDATYPALAQLFFGYLFDKRIVHSSVWVTDDVRAASLWSPPDGALSSAQVDREVALRAELTDVIGVEASERLATYDAAVDAGLPGGSYWYLGVLGSDPDNPVRGAGHAVMRAGLDHVRTLDSSAVLETTNRTNLSYYQRFGWGLVNTIDCTTPSTVWVLRHDLHQ